MFFDWTKKRSARHYNYFYYSPFSSMTLEFYGNYSQFSKLPIFLLQFDNII